MSLYHIVSEIFSIKERRDETEGRGHSIKLKMTPFDRSYTIFYWSAIVTMLYRFFSYLTLNNIVTLKSWLDVT